MNNNKLKEALKDIPTIKSDLLISAYGSIDLDELNKTVERLNKIPNYDDLMKENQKLQSNWNSLRELIEQRIYLIEPKGTCINFYCEYDSEDDYVQGMKKQARLNTLKFILDKMNELEGKDKDE